MFLDEHIVKSNAEAIYNEYMSSERGKKTVEEAKQKWPEYKSDPGYDTTEPFIDYIINDIENHHVSDFAHLASKEYAPTNVISRKEFFGYTDKCDTVELIIRIRMFKDFEI